MAPQTLFFPLTSANLTAISWVTSKNWIESNKFHITSDQPNFPHKNKVCQQGQKIFHKLLNIEEEGARGKVTLQTLKFILLILGLTPKFIFNF